MARLGRINVSSDTSACNKTSLQAHSQQAHMLQGNSHRLCICLYVHSYHADVH